MLHESPRADGRPPAEEPNSPESTSTSSNGGPPAGSSGASRRRCALCGNEYQVADAKLVPFCSPRCQQVDLGNWLSESYGLPWEDPAGGESEPGSWDDE